MEALVEVATWGRGKNDKSRAAIAAQASKKSEQLLEKCGDAPELLRELPARVARDKKRGFYGFEQRVHSILVPLLRAWRDANEKVERIKKKFGLTRDAEIDPNRSSSDWLIAAGLIVEVVMSGLFYGSYSSNILAGVFPALGPSFVTLVVVYLGILCGRHASIGGWQRRSLGWIGVLVSAVMCIGGLFAFSHFRESVGGGTPAFRSAFHHMVLAPMDLSTTSWLMFLITTVIAGVVAFKFWTTRDNVPGLDRAAREAAAAFRRVSDLEQKLRTEMRAHCEGTDDAAGAAQMSQRKKLGDALKFQKERLRHVGIREPSSYEPTEEDPPEVVELLGQHLSTLDWLRQNQDLGDLAVTLGRREEDEGVEDPEVREVESLSSAISAAEAGLWLDGVIRRFGFNSPRLDEEDYS